MSSNSISSRGRSENTGGTRSTKGADQQPGNSSRYLYWRLSEKQFQQMCATILHHKFDQVDCFPVGMADEGIDILSERTIVYQVKWTSKSQQNPVTWLSKAIEGERKNIERLVAAGRVTRYILMTSVAGTTADKGRGTRQKLRQILDDYEKEFGITMDCWWQSDIDAALNSGPETTKWSFQEMLAGTDAVRYLLFGSQVEAEAARMRDTLLQVMATQWGEDSKVKFSQADIDRVDIADLFVDVHATQVAAPRRLTGRSTAANQFGTSHKPSGAVYQLLRTRLPPHVSDRRTRSGEVNPGAVSLPGAPRGVPAGRRHRRRFLAGNADGREP